MNIEDCVIFNKLLKRSINNKRYDNKQNRGATMNINSSTNLICLLGHPVKQSFSPSIHNYLSHKYNKNNVYMCFDIEKIT